MGKLLAGAAALLVIGVLWFALARPVLVLPRIRLGPGYSLVDGAGKTVTSEEGRGKLTLYSFAYSRCEDDCAALYRTLEAIDSGLAARPERSPALRFITLTIDPEYDTQQRLAGFDLPFTPRTVDWRWLTGPEKILKNVSGGAFGVLYEPQEDGSVFFAPRFVLVDGEGVVRAMYDGAELNTERFLDQLDLVYEEIAQAEGAAKLAYEAAHFFACYPH